MKLKICLALLIMLVFVDLAIALDGEVNESAFFCNLEGSELEGAGAECDVYFQVNHTTNITLYLNGISADRRYEYNTTANITIEVRNVENEIVATADFCLDIYDGNGIFANNGENYTCDSDGQLELNYSIWLLRIHNFSDGSIAINTGAVQFEANITHGKDHHIDITRFVLNLTGLLETRYPQNVTIYHSNSRQFDFPGYIEGTNLVTHDFQYNSVWYNKTNITFPTASEKIVYINVTTWNITSNASLRNISWKLEGTDANLGNDLNWNDTYDSTTYIDTTNSFNVSYNYVPVIFFRTKTNTSIEDYVTCTEYSGSSVGNCGISSVNGHFVKTDIASGYYKVVRQTTTHTGSKTYYANSILDFFNLREVDQVKLNRDLASSESGNDWGKAYIYITDESGTQAEIDSKSGVGGDSSVMVYNFSLDHESVKVYNDGVFVNIIDLSSLNESQNWYLKARTEIWSDTTPCSISSAVIIYEYNITGVSLSVNSSFEGYRYYNSTLFSSKELINKTNTITSAWIYANRSIDSDYSTTFFLSANNGTNWEKISNLGTEHTFTNTGTTLRYKVNLNTTNLSESPIIYKVNLKIIPASARNISIDVGDDGITDWNYSYKTLNTTNSPQIANIDGSGIASYITDNCNNVLDKTCLVPIAIVVGSQGIIEFSEFNWTYPLEMPLVFNHSLSNTTGSTMINVTKQGTDGNVSLSGLQMDFYGDRNITLVAHTNISDGIHSNATDDIHLIIVRFSKFLTHLPPALSWFEILPSTLKDRWLAPYGQKKNMAWFRFESLRVDDKIDIYVKLNESLPSCMNMTICDNWARTGLCSWINASDGQRIASNITSTTNTSAWVYVNLNCVPADIPGLIAVEFNFTIDSMCANYSSCVKTIDFDR